MQAIIGLLVVAAVGDTLPTPSVEPIISRLGFATALALQDDELFVGHTGIPVAWQFNASRPGLIHIFKRTAATTTLGSWIPTGTISAPDLATGDGFGSAISIHGNRLAVGAPYQNGGAVYLFQRADGKWRQTARIDQPNGKPGDRFGHSVIVGDDFLAVGAPGADSGRGAVALYHRTPEGWSAPQLAARGGFPGSHLGAVLAYDKGWLAAGAPAALDVPTPQRSDSGGGAVLLLRQAAEQWTVAATLTPPDPVAGFGLAVAIDSNRIYVGSPQADGLTGEVQIFSRSGDAWFLSDRVRPTANGTPLAFGRSLAIVNGSLIVGAPFSTSRAGEIFGFTLGPLGWALRSQTTATPPDQTALFGRAMTASGGYLAVAGPIADFWEGTGWMYRVAAGGELISEDTVIPESEGFSPITGAERRCDEAAAAQFPCADVDLLSFLPNESIGARRGVMLNDIWGWTDPTTSREYALVGRVDGTSFVDVTDPVNPVYLGDLPMHPGSHPNRWRDMKVYQNHLFVVADNVGPHGMQVFDLTRLRNLDSAPVTFAADAHYDMIAESHNIIINEETGFAYAVGSGGGGESCGGGLHIIDIRTPKAPAFVGCHADASVGRSLTGAVHDAQCLIYRGPDQRYHNRELCFNSAETALTIVDVTDKAAIQTVAVASYPNTSYAHQGWLTDDQRFFFMGDEGDELDGTAPKTRTLVWDVERLDEPVLVTEFFGTIAATDHNLYIRGNYMFQSNYAGGLRVIDIRNPTAPHESGYLDTVPGDDNGPGFAGSWSNYPFFPSGTIVVTSRKEGLFVVRHRPRQLVP